MTVSEKIKQALAAEIEKNKLDIDTREFAWFQFRVYLDPNSRDLIKVMTTRETITDLRNQR